MREANDLEVKFNIDTGAIDPPTTPEYIAKRNNLQPRLGMTYMASDKMVVRADTDPSRGKPRIVVGHFSIVAARDANGNPTAVQNPFAEVDYKTSGGRDNYNALQLGMSRRASSSLSLNAQYTLSRSFGNTS